VYIAFIKDWPFDAIKDEKERFDKLVEFNVIWASFSNLAKKPRLYPSVGEKKNQPLNVYMAGGIMNLSKGICKRFKCIILERILNFD